MFPSRRQAALGLAAVAASPLIARAQEAAPDIPIPDEPDANLGALRGRDMHLLAPVTVNGAGPFHFLLDTGANISCIHERLVGRLKLQPGRPTRVHTVVGVRERPSFVIDHLQVGPRDRRRVRVPALPIKWGEIDGILGVDWLKGQRLVLDLRNNALEITRSRTDRSEGDKVIVVPARRRMGQLTIVDADLSARRISAIIDSGAETTLCNAPLREVVRRVEKGRRPTIEPRFINLESIAGETFRGEQLFLPFLRLGGMQLGNVPVVHADMHVFRLWELHDQPAIVLGMDLITQFETVALDFGRSAVRFAFV